MHAFILTVWVFWAPTPVTPHVELRASSAIVESKETCEALGRASLSQLSQVKEARLNDGGFACIPVSDAAEKAS